MNANTKRFHEPSTQRDMVYDQIVREECKKKSGVKVVGIWAEFEAALNSLSSDQIFCGWCIIAAVALATIPLVKSFF